MASGLLTPVLFSLAASMVRPTLLSSISDHLPAGVAVGDRSRCVRASTAPNADAGDCRSVPAVTDEHSHFVHASAGGLARSSKLSDRACQLAGPRGVLPGRGQFRGRKLSRLAARWKQATGRRRWKSVRNRTTGLRSSRVRGGCGWWSIPQTSTMTPRGRWRRSCTAATRWLQEQSFRAVTVTRVRGEERRTITAAPDGQKTKADLHRLHG